MAEAPNANVGNNSIASIADPAEARKRRKAIISSQRSTSIGQSTNSASSQQLPINELVDFKIPSHVNCTYNGRTDVTSNITVPAIHTSITAPLVPGMSIQETNAAVALATAAVLQHPPQPTNDQTTATVAAIDMTSPGAPSQPLQPTSKETQTKQAKPAGSKEKKCNKNKANKRKVTDDSGASGTSVASASSVDTPSKITKNNSKKTQIRYDPDVPMDKDQLAAWRREARRVRNRESAAASRQRIRSRITELESEVEDWKSKYAEALERLHELEQETQVSGGEALQRELQGQQAQGSSTINSHHQSRSGERRSTSPAEPLPVEPANGRQQYSRSSLSSLDSQITAAAQLTALHRQQKPPSPKESSYGRQEDHV